MNVLNKKDSLRADWIVNMAKQLVSMKIVGAILYLLIIILQISNFLRYGASKEGWYLFCLSLLLPTSSIRLWLSIQISFVCLFWILVLTTHSNFCMLPLIPNQYSAVVTKSLQFCFFCMQWPSKEGSILL